MIMTNDSRVNHYKAKFDKDIQALISGEKKQPGLSPLQVPGIFVI